MQRSSIFAIENKNKRYNLQFVRGQKMPVNINIFIILETPL